MKNVKGVKPVALEHIDRGIAKYNGTIDSHLQALIKAAGFQYVPYIFSDGRILLVLPKNLGAFLYDNEDILNESLSLCS